MGKRVQTPKPPKRARDLMRAWEDRGHLFDAFMPFLEAQAVAYTTFHMWTKKYPRVGAFYTEAKATIEQRRRLRKGFTAIHQLGEVQPPKPETSLDNKREAFLAHFAKNGDRIDAARAAGMEWEDVERELEERGTLWTSFQKLERRLDIRLKDRLRMKAIEDGNAAAVNALVKHGIMTTSGASDSGDDHSPEDVEHYRRRLGIVRASYEQRVVN